MTEKTVLQYVEDCLEQALPKDDPFRREVESVIRSATGEGLENETEAVLSICDSVRDRDRVEVRLAVAQALLRDAADTLAVRVADKLRIPLPARVYGCDPTTWPVQLLRTDASGQLVDPRRLVFVWGYACSEIDFGSDDPDRPRVLRLHDQDGTLAVSWSKPPSQSDADAFRFAWSRAAKESDSIVEHWVEGRLVVVSLEQDDEEDE